MTVGLGKAVMLTIKSLPLGGGHEQTEKLIVIGGVIFLLPDEEGWQGRDQYLFDCAYQKHGLEQISKQGLERLKR